MEITSKFNSHCTECGGKLSRGERVEWTQGGGVSHIGQCPEKPRWEIRNSQTAFIQKE
jgi:hypothetical protein